MKQQVIRGLRSEVSSIVYGCMTTVRNPQQNPISDDDLKFAEAAVKTALDCGVNFFDHADIYGRGKAEEAFGAILKNNPGLRDKIVIQSKCGIRFANDPTEGMPGRYDFSYAHIMASVEASLRRLGIEHLDVLLLHRPDPLIEPEEVAKAFDELKRSGKALAFGVSNHNAMQMELLRRNLDMPLSVNQMEFNLMHNDLLNAGVVSNQREPQVHLRADDTVEYCRLHDITLQAWSPIAGGLLTGGADLSDNPAAGEAARLVAKLAEEKAVAREAILTAWILRHPAKIQPVIGATNHARIAGSCQGTEIELSREEWYALFTAARGAGMP